MIRYLLLDLDNTLYPSSTGLGEEMDTRMTEYVASLLKMNAEEALKTRRRNSRRHGSTIKWLMTEGFTRVDEFLDYVHPKNLVEFLDADHAAETQSVLDEISVPASVLTNAPSEHASRVLDCLGIRDRFEHVFDLRWSGFVGKPSPTVYTRALKEVATTANETMLVDDMLQYLLPFRRLGGQIVHVSVTGQVEPGIPTIGALRELLPYVRPERSNS